MELHEALTQIAAIRQQVARTAVFRGYRAAPVAFSGLLAFVTAGVQAWKLPDPAGNPPAFLAIWVSAALLSVLACGGEMVWRTRRLSSALESEKTLMAVGQFLPCLAAGALLLLVFARFAPESLPLLPGLWAVVFGLGIFASCRFLPAGIVWVGVFYLAAGLTAVAWGQGPYAFSPWTMGLPFGIGQLLAAWLLYRTPEHDDE